MAAVAAVVEDIGVSPGAMVDPIIFCCTGGDCIGSTRDLTPLMTPLQRERGSMTAGPKMMRDNERSIDR